MKITAAIKAAADGREQVTTMRAAVADLVKSDNKEIADAAKAFDVKLAAVGGNANGGRRGGGGGGFGAPPPPPNFTSLEGTMVRQLDTQEWGDMAPNEPAQREFAVTCGDLKAAAATWQTLNGSDLSGLNAVLTRNNSKGLTPAAAPVTPPSCGAAPVKPAASGRGRGRG